MKQTRQKYGRRSERVEATLPHLCSQYDDDDDDDNNNNNNNNNKNSRRYKHGQWDM